MDLKASDQKQRSFPHLPIILACVVLFTACKPEGFINKVKYRGEKYINTCESFSAEINKLVQTNNDPNVLKVSQYDNSDFSYYYLEPGQFEIKNDTLYFRLANDLVYDKYLDKGVAVHVNASYQAVDNISDLEQDASGQIGTLVVDREFYIAHRKPFFLYRVPLGGKSLEGKQLMLSFAIAKYDKSGNLKSYFCQTDATPLGVAKPACCTAQPWRDTHLKSIVDFPELDVDAESYLYSGFTGTIDVMFDESSYSLEDDSAYSTILVQSYVDKYKNLGYEVTNIDLSGWASPGGTIKLNQRLSQRRADALAKSLQNGLTILNEENSELEISAEGMGEDWDRVKLLTQTSSLNASQQQEVQTIINDNTLTLDQKEARLRKVSFWETLVEEVLIKARHVLAVMDFEYKGDKPTLVRYTERLPVSSQQLVNVANTVMTVTPYAEGKNIDTELLRIDNIMKEKPSPNLYAMRATYHVADKDYEAAISDLENAANVRGANAGPYTVAVQGYKVLFADNYDFEKKKEMYADFTRMTEANPGDRQLFFNRAILMEKIGFLSGALNEYESLLDGATPTAQNYNNRGVARLKANMFTLAEEDFKKAVSMNSDLADAWFNLAVVYAYKGLTKKTLEHLDKAVELESTYKAHIFNNPAFSVMSEDPRFDKYR